MKTTTDQIRDMLLAALISGQRREDLIIRLGRETLLSHRKERDPQDAMFTGPATLESIDGVPIVVTDKSLTSIEILRAQPLQFSMRPDGRVLASEGEA